MIPFLGALTASRKVIGIVAVLAACAALAYAGHKISSWHAAAKRLPQVEQELEGCKANVQAYKDGVDAANAKVRGLEESDRAAREELAAAKVALETQAVKTSRAWGRVRALEELVNAETGECSVRVSAGWLLCFSAAAAGDAGDVAACEAAGGDGSVAPADSP
jgi:hypothetical protein